MTILTRWSSYGCKIPKVLNRINDGRLLLDVVSWWSSHSLQKVLFKILLELSWVPLTRQKSSFYLSNLFLWPFVISEWTFYRPGVSNSTCSVGHMRTYEVTCGPDDNADATTAVCELTRKQHLFFLRKVSWIIDKSFPAVSMFVLIISSRLRKLFTC